MRLTTSIPRQGTRTRYRRSLTWLMLRGQAVHPAIAQRFSAMARFHTGWAPSHPSPDVRFGIAADEARRVGCGRPKNVDVTASHGTLVFGLFSGTGRHPVP